jgi:hypothetical protein
MPRTFSQPSQDYAVGTYGPFPVDQFTNANTNALEASFTVEGWDPTVNPIMLVRLRWGDGSGADFSVPGQPMARDGTLLSVVRVRVSVPKEADSKKPVDQGSIEVQVLAPLRTAVTLEAV